MSRWRRFRKRLRVAARVMRGQKVFYGDVDDAVYVLGTDNMHA